MRDASPVLLAALLSLTTNQLVVEVPSQLRVTRTHDALEVSIDQRGKTKLTLKKAGGVLGVETQLTVRRGDASTGRTSMGLSSGTSFDVGTTTYHLVPDGLPEPGVTYVVTMTLTLFATDVPVGPHWAPRSGTFTVLWTKTLVATSR